MYIIDCGANTSTLYDSDTNTTKNIKHVDILNLPTELPTGSIVICEYAHLGCPRKKLSRSQPFTEKELLKLYSDFKNNDIELRLFPHQSTRRALNYSEAEKSDINDPQAIYNLLKDFPEISLMKPPRNFNTSNRRLESYDFKHETNEILNIARRYKYLNDENDSNAKFLKDNIEQIINNISDNTKSVFGFTKDCRYKKDNSINFKKIKITQVYSILSMLQDYDGTLRRRENTGKLPGWKFIRRYAIGMSPFHLKGGVARSNLYFHGMRHWVAEQIAKELKVTKKEILKKRRGGYYNGEGKYIKPFTKQENELYIKYRIKYCEAIKEFYKVCKKIMVNV